MLRSLSQIDFIHSGGSVRLLTAGDGVDKEPFPEMKQVVQEWGESGGQWGGADAKGMATGAVQFSARKYHDTLAAAQEWCLLAAGTFPSGRTGILRFTLPGGGVWEMAASVLTASAPAILTAASRPATIQSFSITGSRPVPVTAIPTYPGIPVEFVHQTPEDLTDPIENY